VQDEMTVPPVDPLDEAGVLGLVPGDHPDLPRPERVFEGLIKWVQELVCCVAFVTFPVLLLVEEIGPIVTALVRAVFVDCNP